jgi:hypothetical protein
MQSVSVSQAMEQSTHLPFRPGILSLDRLHDATALVWRSRIGHANRKIIIVSMEFGPSDHSRQFGD